MHNPTNQAETSIPTENVSTGANLFAVRQKGVKRTEPWSRVLSPQNLAASSSMPPVRKKPRFEEPLPTATDEVARLLLDLATRCPCPPPAAETNDNANADHPVTDDDANADPVTDDDANSDSATDTQSNAGETGRWTVEEDAKLTNAVTNTCKKKHGKGYRIDWDTVAALVPGRTKRQSLSRWHDFLKQSIDPASVRTGKWTKDEDSKLKNAVQAHGGKKWGETAALVPGRTKSQCYTRWYYVLDPDFDRVSGHWGKWTESEDSNLKDVVQSHGGKNWFAIAALIPGRAKKQCLDRWNYVLDPNMDQADVCRGKWTADEDSKLREEVHTHGGKKWDATAALLPGRTKNQCYNRWHDVLDPSIDRADNKTGKWTEDEVTKLRDAVRTHGGEEWAAIAALIPGRTKRQCGDRWKRIRLKERDTLKKAPTLV
jgi:hypothetical protein